MTFEEFKQSLSKDNLLTSKDIQSEINNLVEKSLRCFQNTWKNFLIHKKIKYLGASIFHTQCSFSYEDRQFINNSVKQIVFKYIQDAVPEFKWRFANKLDSTIYDIVPIQLNKISNSIRKFLSLPETVDIHSEYLRTIDNKLSLLLNNKNINETL